MPKFEWVVGYTGMNRLETTLNRFESSGLEIYQVLMAGDGDVAVVARKQREVKEKKSTPGASRAKQPALGRRATPKA